MENQSDWIPASSACLLDFAVSREDAKAICATAVEIIERRARHPQPVMDFGGVRLIWRPAHVDAVEIELDRGAGVIDVIGVSVFRWKPFQPVTPLDPGESYCDAFNALGPVLSAHRWAERLRAAKSRRAVLAERYHAGEIAKGLAEAGKLLGRILDNTFMARADREFWTLPDTRFPPLGWAYQCRPAATENSGRTA